jgi:hypothetical protein
MNYHYDSNLPQLIVIFGFVLLVVLMKSIARNRRARMWHETARVALEKGQPLPSPLLAGACQPRDPRRILLGGLILMGIGAALYLAPIHQGGPWVGAIPGFIGLAMVVFCLITRGTNGPGTQGPPAGGSLS